MPQALPGIERWPLPASFSGGLGNRQRGRWFMFGDCRCATAFVDLTQWPPKPIVNSTEYAVSFDELPDGRIARLLDADAPARGLRDSHSPGQLADGLPTQVAASKSSPTPAA